MRRVSGRTARGDGGADDSRERLLPRGAVGPSACARCLGASSGHVLSRWRGCRGRSSPSARPPVAPAHRGGPLSRRESRALLQDSRSPSATNLCHRIQQELSRSHKKLDDMLPNPAAVRGTRTREIRCQITLIAARWCFVGRARCLTGANVEQGENEAPSTDDPGLLRQAVLTAISRKICASRARHDPLRHDADLERVRVFLESHVETSLFLLSKSRFSGHAWASTFN